MFLLPPVSLHPLKGNFKEFWSVTISGNWRIVFRFEDGDAFDVDLVKGVAAYGHGSSNPSRRQFIQFVNFSTGQIRPVVVTNHEIGIADLERPFSI